MTSKLLEVQWSRVQEIASVITGLKIIPLLLWCRCQESAAAKASTTATAAETSPSKAGSWGNLGSVHHLTVMERWPLPLFHLLNVVWEHLTDSIQISWGSLATRKFRKTDFKSLAFPNRMRAKWTLKGQFKNPLNLSDKNCLLPVNIWHHFFVPPPFGCSLLVLLPCLTFSTSNQNRNFQSSHSQLFSLFSICYLHTLFIHLDFKYYFSPFY